MLTQDADTPLHTVTIERRETEHMAFVDGDDAIWGSGPTAAQALYDLLHRHGAACGIRIERKP